MATIDKTTDTPPPVCEDCGREAEVVIDNKGWCAECFQARGSCCSGEFEDSEELS